MKKNIEYQTWVNAPLTIHSYPFNKTHPRAKTFIAAFPHVLPQFFRSKATTSNLYQHPRDTGYDMSK